MKNISAAALLLFLFLSPFLTFAISDGLRVSLKHVDSDGNFTNIELIHRAVHRSHRRLAAMSGRATNGTDNVQAPLYFSSGEYIFDVSIGTPPQRISGVMDTGSDLIWTQCQTTCSNCTGHQNFPLFDPSRSSTYSKISCNDTFCSQLGSHNCTTTKDCGYNYGYGDGYTAGLLGAETFTFGTELNSVSQIVFGCSERTNTDLNNSTGVFGFSPGQLSFVSQLSSPRFSYCFDLLTTESSASTLFLGSKAKIDAISGVQSTPFVDVGVDDPPYYFLNLTGISLGDTRLAIPSSVFQFDPRKLTNTGTIIDSGTSLTRLTKQAYDVVKQAVKSSVNLPIATHAVFDLCFHVPSTRAPSMPDMTFHFDGADMVVPYMFTEHKQLCLMMLPSLDLSSIIGNLQQQNMLMLYDLAAGMLSFAPAKCKEL